MLSLISTVVEQGYSDPSGDIPATIQDLEIVFGKVVDIVLGLAGIVLFIMLIMGGFKYTNPCIYIHFNWS
jgi:hypothetical protein